MISGNCHGIRLAGRKVADTSWKRRLSVVRVFETASDASNSLEIEAAFASSMREGSDALFVAGDPYFYTRRVQLAVLAARHTIPTTYAQRDFIEAGGLMTYGESLTDAYRQVGVYAGRILKGANPADLPVVQSTKIELVINLPTARALGLEVPPTCWPAPRRRLNEASPVHHAARRAELAALLIWF
jgi:ABC-type uncharacterized transport system substrate-binding protein